MVLLNQISLRNILNRQEDLSNPKLRATVAALINEQRENTICFLMQITEKLAELKEVQG